MIQYMDKIGEGAIYAAGIWLARVHYTVAEDGATITLRVCDGERDLFSPPIPAAELLLEFADGSRRWFRPSRGNPAAGTYTIIGH